MIDFSQYLEKYVVLMTNDVQNLEELPGIRNKHEKVFRYKGLYVLARPVTEQDLEDEDFVLWLSSMWKHDESNIKSFLKYKREYGGKLPRTARKTKTNH